MYFHRFEVVEIGSFYEFTIMHFVRLQKYTKVTVIRRTQCWMENQSWAQWFLLLSFNHLLLPIRILAVIFFLSRQCTIEFQHFIFRKSKMKRSIMCYIMINAYYIYFLAKQHIRFFSLMGMQKVKIKFIYARGGDIYADRSNLILFRSWDDL
jgi:hypothetical protein